MNEDCLKLTIYFGERDRANGRFLADALLDVYERHGLQMSVLLRGTEGFGIRHRLRRNGQRCREDFRSPVPIKLSLRAGYRRAGGRSA